LRGRPRLRRAVIGLSIMVICLYPNLWQSVAVINCDVKQNLSIGDVA